jgi:hypothetical protein
LHDNAPACTLLTVQRFLWKMGWERWPPLFITIDPGWLSSLSEVENEDGN